MHIPDGFIDLPVTVAAAAIAVPAVAVATRRSGRRVAEREVPLVGLVAAYLVVAQLLVFPIGLGTGAHLLGTGLAVILVGPAVALACVTVVLVLQAFLFADGGVSALGLNALNNGVVPILVAWAALTLLGRWWRSPSKRSLAIRCGVAAGLATFAGALAFALEFVVGATAEAPSNLIATGFLGAHVVIAAIEGILTAMLVRALLAARPDLVLRWLDPHPPIDRSTDPVAAP